MLRRVLLSAAAASLMLGAGAVGAHAGEITGNGRSLHVVDSKWGTGLHARSACAFSGQEDLQFLNDDGTVKDTVTKGVPGHAQSWGQIPKSDRDFLVSIGVSPGTSCNPMRAAGEP
jgi:hypothetical protein